MSKNFIGKMQGTPSKTPTFAPGLHPGISVNQLKKLYCKCGKEHFIQAVNVYYASPLQTQTGMPMLVQVPQGFVCTTCGSFNDFRKDDMEVAADDASQTVKN